MYNSSNDVYLSWMPKSVWGPLKWKELHARALMNLPMDEESQWFEEYLGGLPCPACLAHFEAFLKDHPPDFRSRPDFFAWTVDAHNYVNEICEKPLYSQLRARAVHKFVLDDGSNLIKRIYAPKREIETIVS